MQPRRDQAAGDDGVPTEVGDGIPDGIVELLPGDPLYPTPAQMLALKGAPGPSDVRLLGQEEVDRLTSEGYLLSEDELTESTSVSKKGKGGLRLL